MTVGCKTPPPRPADGHWEASGAADGCLWGQEAYNHDLQAIFKENASHLKQDCQKQTCTSLADVECEITFTSGAMSPAGRSK